VKIDHAFFAEHGGPAKGETLAASVVCRLMRVDHKQPVTSKLAQMTFAIGYEKHLRNLGYAANVKVTPEGVRWLTDAESIAFNAKRRRAGVRKIHRARRGLHNVETAELSAEDREELERENQIVNMQSAALTRAARQTPEYESEKRSETVPIMTRKKQQ
jgi:hypothetical protein